MSWGLAKVVHVMGDRRDRFVIMADVWDIFDKNIEERKKREINPTLALLRECELEAADDAELPGVSKRTPDIRGTIHAVAPECPDYKNFAALIGHMVHRPVLPRVPAAPMNFLPGEMASILLQGPTITSSRLPASSFTFSFPSLRSALMDLL